ncbi:PDR/VanB family oxidoreductase [Patulibacter sp. NPDC049589]|uniref:PDR/VanB family oxidoreductase n=1 Tax=Patulibacter sp. NPDC049589 TaxID=3154731 RepID=UPI00343795DC
MDDLIVMATVVATKTVVARGVVAVELRRPDGSAFPRWEPGAHIDLGAGTELERQYSLCGDLDDPYTWRIAVLREPASRGGSEWVHDGLHVGDAVAIRGPRHHFPLVEAERYLFVAGGIGITPLLPMIAAVDARSADWRLLYGGRTLGSMAFGSELVRHGDRVTFWPADSHGLLDLAGALPEGGGDLAIYACGPEPLLEAIERHCATGNRGTLNVERFHPRPGALAGERRSFEIVVESSGATVRVGPDEAVVDALERIGIDVPTSCREGTCGTCETGVLFGDIDHRDSYLTADEQDAGETMMVCCSRAHSDRLVLDL